MNKYIGKLYKLTIKAKKHKEVPVAALIIQNNKIVASAYNKREKCNNPLKHAEIIAIEKASKRLKTWKLSECILYVTLKPCKMCEEVIKEARIKEVYYMFENKKEVNKKINFVKINSEKNEECKNNLISFFKEKR